MILLAKDYIQRKFGAMKTQTCQDKILEKAFTIIGRLQFGWDVNKQLFVTAFKISVTFS